MSEILIEVQKREETGKNANRRLRSAGSLPAVLYGDKREPVPIVVDLKVLRDLLRQGGGENTVFLLKLAGTDKSRHAMIRELQMDPISRQIRHVDFQRIRLTEKVKVEVPIEVRGESEGVKNEGGVLDFVTREVEIECLPTRIPQSLFVDVTGLHVGQHVEASKIELPEGVELLEEPERVIISIAHSRVAEQIEEIEAEAEGAEVLIEAEKEEPEVIGRGKEAEAEAED